MIIRPAVKRLTRNLSTRASAILSSLDIPTTGELSGVYDGQWKGSGDSISSICPTTGETLATVRTASPDELHDALERTREAYIHFRSNRLPPILYVTVISHQPLTDVPAPRRGEILRQIREALASKARTREFSRFV